VNSKRNIAVLFVCQALYWGAVIVGITLSAIVGASLAPEPILATLPAGLLALGAIVATAPASLLMQRYGRRTGFRIGTISGALGGALAAYAIVEQSFVGFCLGNLALGLYQACANYYRLAATDSVAANRSGTAIAWVMAGGILAAIVAPAVSVGSKDLISTSLYAGSYLVVLGLSLAATFVLGLLVTPSAAFEKSGPAAPQHAHARSLGEVARQPIFIAAVVNAGVSHGTMILVMTTTPLAMTAHALDIGDAAFVIQWHVLGMFIPAFFSGRLVDRLGPATVSIAGACVFILSITLALSGTAMGYFLVSSFLLGAGWNLMYVAGSTLIAASHRPEERGKVQGAAELGIAVIAVIAAFSSGGLLAFFGWNAVNVGALPLLAAAVLITLWYARCRRREGAEGAVG